MDLAPVLMYTETVIKNFKKFNNFSFLMFLPDLSKRPNSGQSSINFVPEQEPALILSYFFRGLSYVNIIPLNASREKKRLYFK
jgi:hypothetical protein